MKTLSLLLFLPSFVNAGRKYLKSEPTAQVHLTGDHHHTKSMSIATGIFPTNPNYGWLIYYLDSKCTEYSAAETVLLDTCLTTGPTSSSLYSCVGGVVTYVSYSNSFCTAESGTGNYPVVCSSSNVYGQNYIGGCSTSGNSNPYYNYQDNTVTTSYNAASDCNSGVIAAQGYANNLCYATGAKTSSLLNYPNQYYWSNSGNCTGISNGAYASISGCYYELSTGNPIYKTYYETFLYSTGSNDDAYSAVGGPGGLAGIIIACVVVVGIIVAVVLYFTVYQNTSINAPNPPPQQHQQQSKVISFPEPPKPASAQSTNPLVTGAAHTTTNVDNKI